MHQKFTIKGRLPGLNEYTAACRTNAYAGAGMKKKAEQLVLQALMFYGIRPAHTPIYLNYVWYEKDNRRDQDNIAFAQKFIQDAMVSYGVIPNDSRKYIIGSSHKIETDKLDPRIEVTIEEENTLFEEYLNEIGVRVQ